MTAKHLRMTPKHLSAYATRTGPKRLPNTDCSLTVLVQSARVDSCVQGEKGIW